MKEKIKISIIGGTGNLGVPVVKFLLQSGFEITLIVRNINKAKQLFQNSEKLQIIKADLKNVSELRSALSDTEYLYLSLSTPTTDINIPFSAEREGVANILEAINKVKIRQIIAISGLGAFDNVHKPAGFKFVPNIIRKQGHKLIKNSGIPYTILHCSWFADSFVIYRRNNVYSVIGNTIDPIYFTNCYDYTKHLINVLGNPGAFFKEFPIQGDKGFTHPLAAKTFLDVYSENTKIKLLPAGIIKFLALFSKEMKYVKHMSDYFFDSSETFLAEEFNTYKILGSPFLSLTQYAEKLKEEKIYEHLEKRGNYKN
ncbi:MAG: SDR family oxidoreductase [Bacteroidales bacterium]|nr:SDR family oxidoreductase [Bacteroidales bacterium]